MIKNAWKCLMVLMVFFLLSKPTYAAQITIEELPNGFLDVNILIENNELSKSRPVQNGKPYGFTLLLIPFQSSKDWHIESAQDITVSNISTFKGYSLISVIFPNTKSDDLLITINNAAKLSENREGKAKLIVDLNYPYLSGAVKELTDLNFVFSEWKYIFRLLKKYENDELSKSHNSIVRTGDKTFEISPANINPLKDKKVWLVFPNGRQKALDTGKLVISLFVGLLTIILQFSPIRERKLSVILAILAVSGLIVGVSIYYAHYLSKGFELAVWGAALIPHVVMSIIGTIYVLIARQKQAIISIPIQKDGAPIEFGEILLLGKDGNNWIQIDKLEKLVNGNGYFHIWLKAKYSAYKVKAKTTGTQSKESREFSPSPKEKVQLDLINLVTVTSGQSA
ncbi:hypothetical protein [Photobacterium leiognathi]|uniref:hypothetical protein n=1 Tax=Photobacterium leiognathi TaxID=553611 RepID=UPI0029827592|nr:hypothetical protein [Photobacterium leiognathi]